MLYGLIVGGCTTRLRPEYVCMRYAIFGDIHGNYDALRVVLEHAKTQDIDQYICTGDIVGYGAEPDRCIDAVRNLNTLCLAGNHDHAAVEKLDIEYFNIYAKRAAEWTRKKLTQSEKDWLEGLPFLMYFEDFAVAHGSAHGPEVFNYIQTIFDAELSFEILERPILFYGHTHIPLTFFDSIPMTYTMDSEVHIDPTRKVLVNIGSVGQPRDEDPRASYGVFDSDTFVVSLYRLDYDVKAAGRKIVNAGLPEALAIRLELGK